MGFCQQLAAEIRQRPAAEWPQLLVLVPTARVAARVRALLSEGVTGVLPAILPLKGTPELAELLNITMPRAVDSVVAQMEIARVLRQGDVAEDLFATVMPAEALEGERLWRRVESVYAVLNYLAQHGVTRAALRAAVPAQMAALWEYQAATLLRVAQHMDRWLAARGEVWPGAAERAVLEQAAQHMEATDSPWQLLAAGVMEGTPAAHRVLQVVGRRGTLLLPELGPATAELLAKLESPFTPLALPAGPLEEAVAETDRDEAWVAALAVRRAVQTGEGRVAVVSPSRSLLARVTALLEGWDIHVAVGGGRCLSDTPHGREATAALYWGERGRKLTQWLELMTVRPLEIAGWGEIVRELQRLKGEDFWLEAADWQAVMLAILQEAPAASNSREGVFLLGPLEARLLDFDTVVVAGCVEGTWPALSTDAWLSEPHLRALGLPDRSHKALLAGTELESLLHSGSGRVLVTRAQSSDGKDTVRSRFLAAYALGAETELPALAKRLRASRGETRTSAAVSGWQPHGRLWPKTWSASFIEALLACPYRALGERVLKLAPPEPLTPLPDARTAGLLVHRWLERAGTEEPRNQGTEDKERIERLLEIAEEELAHEAPVTRAIWRGKMAKLAPALVAAWQETDRRMVAVEQRVSRQVGAVTVAATLDRVDDSGTGKVILDYKTGTPPAWSKVAAGIKPQLALEAWLLGGEVEALEYWHLKGYGSEPLTRERAGPDSKQDVAGLLAPVEDGLQRLIDAYREGAVFAAVPDRKGGGLQATGHCEYCQLAGVCRRKEMKHA